MLDGWVDPVTNKLFRYTQPSPDKIVVKRVGTSAAGFEKRLYEMSGVPDEYAQRIESDFLQHIDNNAAVAHAMLTAGRIRELTSEQKVHWVQFIMMMMFRTPRNLEAYKDGYRGLWGKPTPETTACYQRIWQLGWPQTEEEYITKYLPDEADHLVMREFPRIAMNTQFAHHLLGMRWYVLLVEDYRFLISDEPIVMHNGIWKPGGHVAMPLTANSMFLATYDEETFERIERMRPHQIVKDMNKFLVQRASKFVGARDTAHEVFIRRHFGTKPVDTIATKFAAKYRSS